jgi:hypothetical protein
MEARDLYFGPSHGRRTKKGAGMMYQFETSLLFFYDGVESKGG